MRKGQSREDVDVVHGVLAGILETDGAAAAFGDGERNVIRGEGNCYGGRKRRRMPKAAGWA